MAEDTRRSPEWVAPAAIVLFAFFFRLFLGRTFTYFGGDAPQYSRLGKNLAAGHGYSLAHAAPYLASDVRLPAYPAVLALGYIFSHSAWSFIIVNSVLGAVSTYLVWLIAKGVGLSRTRSLWSMGIAAVLLSTATIAGIAQSESLSIPAVLAFVYVVLIHPPAKLWALFVFGSLLAWLLALTRDEMLFFVVIVAMVAARRAGLKLLASVALVVCFVLGSAAWTLRNEVQVHRVELVDRLMTDGVLVSSVNGNLAAFPYRDFGVPLRAPQVAPAERAHLNHIADTYVKNRLEHHLPAVVQSKVKYFLQSVFPVPIYGVSYVSTSDLLGRLVWSLITLAAYLMAIINSRIWWRSGRKRQLVSILIFPVFILIFELIFDPQARFVMPADVIILPLVVDGFATIVGNERAKWATAKKGPPPAPADDRLSEATPSRP